MNTTTCYEVRDGRGRNVGECYDHTAEQAIERAEATADAIAGLGPLEVYRLEQRVVVQTMCEERVAVIDGTRVQATATHATLRGLRASSAPRERLAVLAA